MGELRRIFLGEIVGNDDNDALNHGLAKPVKYTVVRTPTSVYKTLPGREAL